MLSNKIFRRVSSESGLTLAEMLVTSAVLGIIAAATAYLLMNVTKGATSASVRAEAQEKVRIAFSKMEMDFLEMNEVTGSSATAIIFLKDYTHHKNYKPAADADADGIVNIMDPDIDADAAIIVPATAQWRIGYNLFDDDDDNDGKRDVQVVWYSSQQKLFRRINYNESGWSAPEKMLDGVSSFSLAYFGSKKEDVGRLVDLGNDGLAGTGDAGEGDGVITEREIDWTLPLTGHGNRSGGIDTAAEKKYIVTIQITAGVDYNGDGVEDFSMQTEISPPLLVLKRNR